jgi:tetratricopeptide (TPR) repeat protein
LERALMYARKAGDNFQAPQIAGELVSVLCFGPLPADEVIRRCDDILQQTEERLTRATIYSALRLAYAQTGDFRHARQLGQRAEEIARDLGQAVLLGMWSEERALVELLAGNLEAAELLLRDGCDALAAMGEKGFLSTRLAELAQVLCDQDRYDEAETYTTLSRDTAAPWDVASQARWRFAQARVLASRGEIEASERLSQEAIEISRGSDDLDMRGDVLMNCAQALVLAKRHADAAAPLKDAIRLYEQKGNVVSAAKARKLLTEPSTVDL